MILTGRDLRGYLQSGYLKIAPLQDSQIQQNGVDLILDEVMGHPVVFLPGRMYLGATREELVMPHDLMAFVELRSTWARSGLMLPPTIVDAGFHGNLTLEIVPFMRAESDTTVKHPPPVPYGHRFAHLIFARLTGLADPYMGKYQGQWGVTAPIPDAP